MQQALDAALKVGESEGERHQEDAQEDAQEEGRENDNDAVLDLTSEEAESPARVEVGAVTNLRAVFGTFVACILPTPQCSTFRLTIITH